jgi:hypothetical protein
MDRRWIEDGVREIRGERVEKERFEREGLKGTIFVKA